MRMHTLLLGAGSLVLAASIHALQEDSDMAAMMPAAAGPGEAHKILAHFQGEWEATMTMDMMPGQEVKGTEVNKVALGGLWILGEFDLPDFMGQGFAGHNVLGWDAEKEKYVGIWVDSQNQRIATQEGDYDEATKALTMWNDGRGMSGEPVREKHITTFVDENTRTFSMQAPGPEGEYIQTMLITYKRKR